MDLNDCFSKRLDLTQKIKIIRHQDPRLKDVNMTCYDLYRTGLFEEYQSYQEEDIFKNCDVILSFIGLEGFEAVFIGAYKVISTNVVNGLPHDIDVPYKGVAKVNSKYHYKLEKIDLFPDYEEKLIIDFGSRRMDQWFTDKQVVQLLPPGYAGDFPGYLEVILSFDRLENIINFPKQNRNWREKLSSVKGIYLVLDKKTGLQYIGSAYNGNGILGRWKKYVHTGGSANNDQLVEIIKSDPSRTNDFQFTILRTLPMDMTQTEVLTQEKLFKLKLGTRVHGLNSN
ncbi:GIY-YIG nuclease family protein [Peribacillus asahii]|uniref:GIY-YIG nuclease family protein n=1 Tax=Peribacillus asahii TaxID=228899 RepID=UPI00382B7C75